MRVWPVMNEPAPWQQEQGAVELVVVAHPRASGCSADEPLGALVALHAGGHLATGTSPGTGR